MRVLMLNPPFLPRFSRAQRSPAVTKSGTLYYPIWLAYAAGVLEDAGMQVRLIDAPADGTTLERLRELVGAGEEERELLPARPALRASAPTPKPVGVKTAARMEIPLEDGFRDF
jgi:hypothetical protein